MLCSKMTTTFWIFFFPFLLIKHKAISGRESSASVSSILIFGDSTADPGNNNYIYTPFKSDFSPYGRDFFNHSATGRFTNGRLANDFIAKYIGLKEMVPAYLDPSLTIDELISGVSFASAGSGFDPLTPSISNVIPLSDQLSHLKEYRQKVEAVVGEAKAKEVLSNALFLVSAGTNDFVVNYFTLPIRRRSYTIPRYIDFVSNGATQFLQELLDEGARRIGVVGLPPMGCLPLVITLFTNHPILDRGCNEKFSSVARDYNKILRKELDALQVRVRSSGARIAYLDAYTPLEEMIIGHKYGFDVVNSGCCGTGMVEAAFLCNRNSPVCDDASKYVFWDSIHPTQKSYHLVFQSFRPALDYLVGN
ncbi:GDSL esterase/lipase At5g45960-like [Salvia hispanica]|uniref:GDSL esterase/lipase At5g45960-like n=1 Tax=Salvia hispanica TaxID=49212 RepID=UPI0020095844|nr:GDSL esterase/lipase At5g45960-like [Salvia hispanica]